jgi:hypothetical protein
MLDFSMRDINGARTPAPWWTGWKSLAVLCIRRSSKRDGWIDGRTCKYQAS